MGNTKRDPNKITSYPLPLVPPPVRGVTRGRAAAHMWMEAAV